MLVGRIFRRRKKLSMLELIAITYIVTVSMYLGQLITEYQNKEVDTFSVTLNNAEARRLYEDLTLDDDTLTDWHNAAKVDKTIRDTMRDMGID
ncbi:hypothetical protein LCGC14_0660300 [marine sediment metagenome]|uniref:Uncharacterized protein n=1 Tax=marine sediment metagenome TaxID=412755 RepID=A0A0F9RDS4_9ZZZZ